MNSTEIELERRLNALPDGCPDFTKCGMFILRNTGLVDEALEELRKHPNATVDTITMFDSEYRGTIERYNPDGSRVPVDVKRLRLTRGMRDMLAQMKSKTLKSFEIAPLSNGRDLMSDCTVRLTLGQCAIDINCFEFTYSFAGSAVDFSQLLCERRHLLDDFQPWSDAPSRAYAVGERITGVELVSEHIVLAGGEALDIDVAIAVRTAHAVYTLTRESWTSTNICIAISDELAVSREVDERNAAWLREHPELGEVKVGRSMERLA